MKTSTKTTTSNKKEGYDDDDDVMNKHKSLSTSFFGVGQFFQRRQQRFIILQLLLLLMMIPSSVTSASTAARQRQAHTHQSHQQDYSPSFVSFGSRSTTPSSPSLLISTDLSVIDLIPRGGASGYSNYHRPSSLSYHHPLKGIFGLFGSFKKKSAAQYYRESLEEQVLLLDRQLRQARDEISKLREERTTTMSSLKKESSSRSKTKKRRQNQVSAIDQQRLTTLQKQVKELEQMKLDLEGMLVNSASKIEELEAKLAEEEELTKQLIEKYETQIAELRENLEETSREQLLKVEQLMEERIKEAEEAARIAEQAKWENTIAEITANLKEEHSKALESERKKSAQAVEQEKKKMRKLVRALAIREKKLRAKSERESKQQKQKHDVPSHLMSDDISRTPVVPSSQINKPKSTPTTRGRI